VSPGRLRSWMLPALALLILAHPGSADSPAAGRCDKKKAEKPFSSGMSNYWFSRYQGAILSFEKAVNFCPAPSGPWSVQVGVFGDVPYTPFYYLGDSHYNLKDLPAALRNFSLASCVGEGKWYKNATKNLASRTEECRQKAAGKDRFQSLTYFRDGFTAKEKQKWEEEAEKMWEALHVWKDEGGTTNSHGRWPDPYLPRFHLAEALYNLGCYREAADQMNRSLLGTLKGPEVEEERRQLSKLKPDCEQKIRQGYQDKEICQRWQCLLQ